MDHIQISLTVNSAGRVIGGRVEADHHERIVSGNPGRPAIPDNHHVYNLAQGGTSGNRITAAFYSVAGSPRCSASFVGQYSGNRLKGTLFFARNDAGPPWSGKSTVQ
jgi:hypothetical protein